eukprot:gene20302-26353_t
MSKLLFHGKTAIITGAGGALGKSYAIELAKRGANVVVNDIYGTNDVIKEIESFGGIAISNNSDVINGKDIIDDTISRFGSGAGLYGNFGQANYSSAKMGIVGLTNTLAIEGEKYGINVNCVIPIAASKMTQNLMKNQRNQEISMKLAVDGILRLDCKDHQVVI